MSGFLFSLGLMPELLAKIVLTCKYAEKRTRFDVFTPAVASGKLQGEEVPMSGNRPKGKQPAAPKPKLASSLQPSASSKSGNSNHWKKTGQHIYRYHPPRADHPLLQSAQPAVQLATVPKSVDFTEHLPTNSGSRLGRVLQRICHGCIS
jgi:hypothetical protein